MCYPILPIINLPAPPSQNYTVAPLYVSEDIREVVSEGGREELVYRDALT